MKLSYAAGRDSNSGGKTEVQGRDGMNGGGIGTARRTGHGPATATSTATNGILHSSRCMTTTVSISV